ncbi:hypothetical protein B0J15DRAFT_97102 [Fusarium solani]|uniref:Secreted protein n=1 Tax=Fusarium solani TaxID=169388 RepID=A0A9P9L342_FUSSL|nr:uncharacterized protein B0J15DRAFT_97102 [Fusarium solani]KAH7273332.1 hypothetical protein B0J15DRAFT_97102 [Fusarium solani]
MVQSRFRRWRALGPCLSLLGPPLLHFPFLCCLPNRFTVAIGEETKTLKALGGCPRGSHIAHLDCFAFVPLFHAHNFVSDRMCRDRAEIGLSPRDSPMLRRRCPKEPCHEQGST